MAINVDTVYQKVLALANKEQRGYITPQEFNLLADKAQNEIYENYFHGVKMSEAKPKNQMSYADELEMLEEKLHPFHVDTTFKINDASLTLPSNIQKIISITRANGTKVTQINKSEICYIENNSLTKATLTRSTFVREDSNTVTIYPAPSSLSFNVSSTTGEPSLNNDYEEFEISYYKNPTPPNWTYVVVNEKALYNASADDAQNFELHSSEEEPLVTRILMLAGLTIKQPDVMQAGSGGIQMLKQEQNS